MSSFSRGGKFFIEADRFLWRWVGDREYRSYKTIVIPIRNLHRNLVIITYISGTQKDFCLFLLDNFPWGCKYDVDFSGAIYIKHQKKTILLIGNSTPLGLNSLRSSSEGSPQNDLKKKLWVEMLGTSLSIGRLTIKPYSSICLFCFEFVKLTQKKEISQHLHYARVPWC